MTTEQGFTSPHDARSYIERLRRRMLFLRDRIILLEGEGRNMDYDKAEVAALRWALPVLETEWADLLRMRDLYGHQLPDSKFAVDEDAKIKRQLKNLKENQVDSH